MKKDLNSGILSADKSADDRLTVFWVNVIAVLTAWVVSDLIGNPEDSFSYDAAHFNSEM